MQSKKRMPVLFVGHGSPMNAIEDNTFRKSWTEMGKYLGKPKAILGISAHWQSDDLKVSTSRQYRQIYDMYGFPDKLYQVEYHPVGEPAYAQRAIDLLGSRVSVDNEWGIDHGIWSVLVNMYPDADVPVVMMSVAIRQTAQKQFETGRMLRQLRDEGVLILASGNVVHNLSLINWNLDGGYDWAYQFDGYIKRSILDKQYQNVIHYQQNAAHEKAFRTVEHYYPLLNALGAVADDDTVTVWNESCMLGSMSMTSYLFE